MAAYKAGITGYFTDHPLRPTAVSRLSQEGVNDKLIDDVALHDIIDGHQAYTPISIKVAPVNHVS